MSKKNMSEDYAEAAVEAIHHYFGHPFTDREIFRNVRRGELQDFLKRNFSEVGAKRVRERIEHTLHATL